MPATGASQLRCTSPARFTTLSELSIGTWLIAQLGTSTVGLIVLILSMYQLSPSFCVKTNAIWISLPL